MSMATLRRIAKVKVHTSTVMCASVGSQEVDKRSDAIRKCGAEILRLRKHVEVLEKERGRVVGRLKTLQRSAAEAEMVGRG